MLTKLLFTALILALAWLVFFRRRPRPSAPQPPRIRLVRCPVCRIHHPQGAPCACQRLPD